MDYFIFIRRAKEGGFWAEIPALPGFHVHGESIDDLLSRVPQSIQLHHDTLRDDGQAIPIQDRIIITTVRYPEQSAA